MTAALATASAVVSNSLEFFYAVRNPSSSRSLQWRIAQANGSYLFGDRTLIRAAQVSKKYFSYLKRQEQLAR